MTGYAITAPALVSGLTLAARWGGPAAFPVRIPENQGIRRHPLRRICVSRPPITRLVTWSGQPGTQIRGKRDMRRRRMTHRGFPPGPATATYPICTGIGCRGESRQREQARLHSGLHPASGTLVLSAYFVVFRHNPLRWARQKFPGLNLCRCCHRVVGFMSLDPSTHERAWIIPSPQARKPRRSARNTAPPFR